MIPYPDISPELFSISIGSMSFALRWYALAYVFGLLIGWWIALRAVRAAHLWPDDTPPIGPPGIERLVTWLIVGVIVGGRLGYVLFYDLPGFLADPVSILRIWQGGMSFHGGFAGVVLAGLWFCRREGLPPAGVGDLFALAVPPGLFLGRIANFINNELWGRATDLPWGVVFPGELAQACATAIGPCARHPSQIYEALLEGVLLGGVILWLALRRGWLRRPGALVGVFLAGYGLARFLVEFVRQPDAQFISPGNPLGLALHVGGYGLTMGQALSLPMIVVGLWLMRHAWRRRIVAP